MKPTAAPANLRRVDARRATPKAPFALHDVSEFPVVRFDTSRAAPGYAATWVSEMEALLTLGLPFVLVATGSVKDSAADREACSLFLQSRHTDLARRCRAIVGVEPNAAARAARSARAAVLAKAFRIEMVIVATEEAAITVARARLSEPEGMIGCS